MTNFDYDYFVIGAGSGGVRSARIAASHGAKVGIAECAALGGTCVNLGCVPKKLFSYAAHYGYGFEEAKGYGWKADNIIFDWQTLRENKTKEIKRLNSLYETTLKNNGVTLIRGYAEFEDAHTIKIDNIRVTAKNILIATGGKPKRPVFPGAEHVVVSDDIFYLPTLPKKVIIQGGGYVSVEFAHILHGLGVDVTIIYRDTIFLKGFDSDIRDFLADEMRKQGIHLCFNRDIESIEKTNNGYKVLCDDECTTDCDKVFSAIGRVANTQGLQLQNAGVKSIDNGYIPTNEYYQTNIPHIYAVGDITSRYALTPVAIAEGHAVADNLFGNLKRTITYENVATAIFSNPPIGTVGLSEDEARQKNIDFLIYKTSFKPMRHTLSGQDQKTFIKLVVEKGSNKVLGVHIVGQDAPEIIQAVAIALNAGATKADFDRTMAVHPTVAEELVLMRTPFVGQ